jgi:hypothetical protein
MNGKNKIVLLLTCLAICMVVSISGQTKIQVVTRTISKVFDNKQGCILDIKAEKANILVKTSIDGKIKTKLFLIAKNPSKLIAEADLKFLDYQINESSNTISITNFFNEKNGYKEISSNLSARYEIEVPVGIILKIKNLYGETQLLGINAQINVSSGFGQIKISNLSGSINISSNYSDIKGEILHAVTSIDAQNADIALKDINNPLTIKTHYGAILLEQINANVTIESEMTEIKIKTNDSQNIKYDITGISCDFILPEEWKKKLKKNAANTYFTNQTGNNLLKIKNTYSTINIEKK